MVEVVTEKKQTLIHGGRGIHIFMFCPNNFFEMRLN